MGLNGIPFVIAYTVQSTDKAVVYTVDSSSELSIMKLSEMNMFKKLDNFKMAGKKHLVLVKRDLYQQINPSQFRDSVFKFGDIKYYNMGSSIVACTYAGRTRARNSHRGLWLQLQPCGGGMPYIGFELLQQLCCGSCYDDGVGKRVLTFLTEVQASVSAYLDG